MVSLLLGGLALSQEAPAPEGAPAAAPEPAGETPEESPEDVAAEGPAVPESPPEPAPKKGDGVISGERVNIRTGPGTDHGRLYQSFKGDKVEVVGREGEWVKILLPKSVSGWIASQYLAKDSDGKRGVVRGDRVSIRAGGGEEFDSIGLVNRGYTFLILAEINDYCKVTPLPDAVGFVHGKYVKIEGEVPGEVPGVQAAGSQPVAPIGDLQKALKTAAELFESENAKPLVERDYAPVIKSLVAVIGQSREGEPFVHMSARKLLTDVVKEAKAQDDERRRLERNERIQEMLKAIEDKYKTAGEDVSPPATYGSVGVLEILSLDYPPATHKLVEKSTVKCLAYSEKIDLAPFVGKRVGIVGETTALPDFGTVLFKVTRIDPLPEE